MSLPAISKHFKVLERAAPSIAAQDDALASVTRMKLATRAGS